MQVFNGFMQNGIVGRTETFGLHPSHRGNTWLGCRNSLPRILEAVDDLFHLKGALKVWSDDLKMRSKVEPVVSAGQPDGSGGGSEGLVIFYFTSFGLSDTVYFKLFLGSNFGQAVHSLLDLGSFVISGWSEQSFS